MKRQDALFRALADPSRRAILQTLSRGEAPVKDLVARHHISQPAVSQHLAKLRRAGLVSQRRGGRMAYFRIEPEGLQPLIDWLELYRSFWPQRVERLKKLLGEMSD